MLPSRSQRTTSLSADIDLAENLADFFQVELHLIKTSWPSLLDDFGSGKFDIAMSGVSITDARSRYGLYSAPYHIGGKTPITLCARTDLFRKVEDINQRQVTVIVNPGGTNERFVDQRLPGATKKLHNDNRTIFLEIINGNADLMVTDKIEVMLQSAIHPELCGTGADPFTYQEKAYLMAKDKELQQQVNAWLTQTSDTGILDATIARHLQVHQ